MMFLSITGTPACWNPREIWPTMSKAGSSRRCMLTKALIIVNSRMINTVRRAERKKKSFARCGNFCTQKVHTLRIKYSMIKADIPIAASYFFADGRFFKLSMIIWYAGPRLLKSAVSPSRVLTCPAQMVIADPVIKEAIDGRGIKSTMNPSRAKPMKVTILPQMIVIDMAICGPGILG